jgi:hypothetical protein
MNIKNFSLDYIQPSDLEKTSVVDPWAQALRNYGPTILRAVQEGGHKTVQDLFETTRTALNVPQLQLEQFVGVIDRLILNGQLTLVKKGDSSGEAVVALAVPSP